MSFRQEGSSGSFSSSGIGCRGFTLFELIVVITIISVLAVFALDYYRKLLVEVEQSTLEYNLGSMRSALAMQFAAHFVAGDMQGLEQLVDKNPMDLLAERPKNYLGTIGANEARNLEPGNWYFDNDLKQLVYLVRNRQYFSSPLSGTPRIRFKIYPVISEKKQGTQTVTYLSGLKLKAMDPYRWLKPIILGKRKN